jgi:hypothetical protein
MLKYDGVLNSWAIVRERLPGFNWIQHRRIRKTVSKSLIRDQRLNDVHQTLTKKVSYVYGMAVEGDIAEFGTAGGFTAVALATAVGFENSHFRNDPRRGKWIHYFDSFIGLPEARSDVDKNSHHFKTGVWAQGGCRVLSETQLTSVINKILPLDVFSIHSGWFKDTVSSLPDGIKFSLIHIDGDLYESCIDVLDPIFERGMLSSGAVILFDDYDCNRADNDFGERRAWREMVEKYKINFSDGGSYGIACHWFLVHSYVYQS